MAEDVYQAVKEKGMLDQVMFISLDYELINRLEYVHPDAETGYLCFFSFGKIEDMNCDALLLEEESATEKNIQAIHSAGKKVFVWTVNRPASLVRFIAGNADGIITDEVEQAESLKSAFAERRDELRVMQMLQK